MNVVETRCEMETRVASWQDRLRSVTDAAERLRLVEQARHEIQLLRKAAKRRIDLHRRYSPRMRAGIEQKLQKITEACLAMVDRAVIGPP